LLLNSYASIRPIRTELCVMEYICGRAFNCGNISIHNTFFSPTKSGGRSCWSCWIAWLIFWSVIAVLAVVPHEFSVRIAGWLGFASNINAIIFIALAFVIILSFYLSSKLDTLERKVTELVRQLALDESKIRELERKRISQQQKGKKVLEDA